jgi:hypothetical protein
MEDLDEWFYILTGEFLVKVGDHTFKAKAGDSALLREQFLMRLAKSTRVMQRC